MSTRSGCSSHDNGYPRSSEPIPEFRGTRVGWRTRLSPGSGLPWLRTTATARSRGEPGAWRTASAAMAVAVADPVAVRPARRAATTLPGRHLVAVARGRRGAAGTGARSRWCGQLGRRRADASGTSRSRSEKGRASMRSRSTGRSSSRISWERVRRAGPGYVSAMSQGGVAATYTFPLHVGAVRLGVLELYGAQVRSLGPDEISVALVFAEAATDSLVDPPAERLGGTSGGARGGRHGPSSGDPSGPGHGDRRPRDRPGRGTVPDAGPRVQP